MDKPNTSTQEEAQKSFIEKQDEVMARRLDKIETLYKKVVELVEKSGADRNSIAEIFKESLPYYFQL